MYKSLLECQKTVIHHDLRASHGTHLKVAMQHQVGVLALCTELTQVSESEGSREEGPREGLTRALSAPRHQFSLAGGTARFTLHR